MVKSLWIRVAENVIVCKSGISYLTLLNSLLFLADLGSLVTSASLTSSPECGGLEAIPAWSECSGSVRVSGWESDMAPGIINIHVNIVDIVTNYVSLFCR